MSYRVELNDALHLLRKARESNDNNNRIRYIAQTEIILTELLMQENANDRQTTKQSMRVPKA